MSSVDLDAWLVEQAAYLAASGEKVHVAVTARSVMTGTLSTSLGRAIGRAGADPDAITVEIDEAVAVQETATAARFAHQLRNAGANVAINDFALRYRRREHLERIPVRALKIDPWLVQDVPSNYRSAALLAEIVVLAQHYELETIAEGVDAEDLMMLLDVGGVDCVQGYFRQRCC